MHEIVNTKFFKAAMEGEKTFIILKLLHTSHNTIRICEKKENTHI